MVEEGMGNYLSALVFLEAEGGGRKLDILGSGLNTEDEDLEWMRWRIGWVIEIE